MPQLKSAEKRMRQDAKKRLHNQEVASSLRTHVKKIRGLVKEGKIEDAKKMLPIAQAAFDKAAKTRRIHANNASRSNSRLASLIAKATVSKK